MLPLKNPWPKEKPDFPPDPHGWFSDKRANALTKLIKKHNVKTVLEIGAWFGQSTRFFAKHAYVVTVDTWLGSPKHWREDYILPKLPSLYETFLVNCWEDRKRIWPLRMNSRAALRYLTILKISFDLVFIDGDHEYETVKADILDSQKLAPVVCGDDYQNKGVGMAVKEIYGSNVGVEDRVWWAK